MASLKRLDGGLAASPATHVVLGIDPSLTGFAVTALSSHSTFETWLYRSSQAGVERLMDISLWLSSRIQSLQDDGRQVHDVAIEGTVVLSHSAVALGELHGVVRTALYHALPRSKGRYPLQVPPTMVKKFATDRGNARKNEVMLAVYKRYGVEFADDNMADSYVLARMAAGHADTDFQRLLLERLADPKFRDPPRR